MTRAMGVPRCPPTRPAHGTRTRARALVAAFFDRLGAGSDVDGWLDLIHDDIEVDTPFSPTGEAVRFEGKAAIERRFGDARRRMPEFAFFDVEILATRGPPPLGGDVPLRGRRGQRGALREHLLLDLPAARRPHRRVD